MSATRRSKKRRDAIKVIFHDGAGLCPFYKRLDRGTFRILEPKPEEATTVEIDEAALDDLLDGIDVQAASSRTQTPRRSQLH
jgi:transposase